VRYASAAAFRRALETRLLERSQGTGLSLVRLRRAVVFDRLLARLLAVAAGRWVLKGGLALDYRLGARARTTQDLDLGRQDDEAAATADLRRAEAEPLDDFFVFAVERTAVLDEATEGAAVRYRVRASLAGRPFETVTLDVGFGPPPTRAPETLPGPDLLAFAGLEPVAVPLLPLEDHVAEKVHAYTRRYGAAGAASTRVKDLVDLVLIATTAPLSAGALHDALEATFAARATHPLPPALPAPPPRWAVPYARLAADLGLDPDAAAGHGLAAGLVDPALAGGASAAARWDPAGRRWSIAGDARG
jgi:hypothetical protein